MPQLPTTHHIKLTRLFSRIAWAPNEVELVEETLEDIHPIRLKDANQTFTENNPDRQLRPQNHS